jgi:L-2-hydroxyglutarate oxidase LhgO
MPQQLKLDSFQPAYSGIRPKLKTNFGQTGDLIIQGYLQTKIPVPINLYGIESSRLTASLFLAELIAKE